MKHLKYFKIFEQLDNSTLVNIEQLLQLFGIQEPKRPQIVNWWNENRSNIKIHYFPFNTQHPICGVFLSENVIAINSKVLVLPHVKLFLALHESRHCDQHREGRFMAGYYDTVIEGDKPGFMTAYIDLERDANDFAINSMRQCGFELEMNREEGRLRMNERAGEMVWNMMTADIQRLRPVDFFDLLKKQIL